MAVVIISEARSGKGLVPVVNKAGKLERMFIDSPLQNIIDSARIAAELTRRGKQVIFYGVIDAASLSYYDYNYPRTLANYLRSRADVRGMEEEIAHFFGLPVERIRERMGDSYAYYWWIKNAPLKVDVDPQYKEALLKIENARIPAPIRRYFATNLVQRVEGIRESPIPVDSSVSNLVKEIEQHLGPAALNLVHLRIARYLFYLAFEHFKGNKQNLVFKLGMSPSQTIDEWPEIEKALDPIFMAPDFGGALKRFISAFSILYEGYSNKHKNIVPLAFAVDGYFTSATLANIKRDHIEIRPRTPWGTVGKYKLYPDELRYVIKEKGLKGLITIKYPLVIVDHLLGLLSTIEGRTLKKTSTYINEIAHQVLSNGANAMEGLLKMASNIKDIEAIYFVEGDGSLKEDGTLGEPRINLMTGGASDKAFRMIAEEMGAEFIRVISAPREIVEDTLSRSQKGAPIVVSYQRAIEAAEEAGMIINGEWTRSIDGGAFLF
ncbi:MAG: hypothetical protein GXN92_01885 [Candidatus Micrarchaeota archaeon]|nr:hypothetical protein [Candidatus Micrarchaeota archaeon]